MRWVIWALVVLALPRAAFADDWLRGTVGPGNFTNWSGFYVGGEVGYSSNKTDFSGATQAPLAFALRETTLEADFAPSNWPLLGSATGNTISYGGFVGYNTQWQDMILGFEGDYRRASLTVDAPSSSISRRVTTVDSNSTEVTGYDVTATGGASLTLIDYASLRARAGWIFGNFLPYGYVGAVVGRSNYTRSSTVAWQQDTALPPAEPVLPCNPGSDPQCLNFAFTSAASGNSVLMYGFSIGAGLDVALKRNIFLRGEFEYVQFIPVEGILVDLASARAGLGFKF
jgi:outer membrane immunogenic protein